MEEKARGKKRRVGRKGAWEEKAREITKAGLSAKRGPKLNLADSIRRHFTALGGVTLVFQPREAIRRPPR
jgi:hypothetical protein